MSKPTWASIRRSIGRGEHLLAITVDRYLGPTEGLYIVTRTTSTGMYIRVIHGGSKEWTNAFVAWPKASMVKVIDRHRWVIDTGKGQQAWTILPDPS